MGIPRRKGIPDSFMRGFESDPRVQQLSEVDQFRLLKLCAYHRNGELTARPGEDIARRLQITMSEYDVTLNSVATRGLLPNGEPLDFRKRYYKPGSSTARVRRYRARQRECNAQEDDARDVTHIKEVSLQSVTHCSSVSGTEEALDADIPSSTACNAQDGSSPDVTHIKAEGVTHISESRTARSALNLDAHHSEAPDVTPSSTVANRGNLLCSADVVVSSCFCSSEENSNKNTEEGDSPPNLSIAPSPTEMASPENPMQLCFQGTATPPALKVVPPEDVAREEYAKLLFYLPIEERDTKKHKDDLKYLQRTYLKHGYGYVHWAIRYVLEDASYEKFWQYLKTVLKHEKWVKDFKDRIQALEYVQKADKEAAHKDDVEIEHQEREKEEARIAGEKALLSWGSYYDNLADGERQDLRDEMIRRHHHWKFLKEETIRMMIVQTLYETSQATGNRMAESE